MPQPHDETEANDNGAIANEKHLPGFCDTILTADKRPTFLGQRHASPQPVFVLPSVPPVWDTRTISAGTHSGDNDNG